MTIDFPEADWKTLSALKPVLLDRLCTRILDELRVVIDDDALTAHERYLRLFDVVQDRNDEIAAGFDDMRRSRAIERLANLYDLGLFTSDELARFTPRIRDSFIGLAESYRDMARRRGR